MEETKELLVQLTGRMDNLSFKETLNRLNEDIRELETTHSTSKEAIEDSIVQVTRRNKQLESEVERLQLLQSKNSSAFNKKNNERIKLSRKIIELEQENEEMETKLNELENQISKMEDRAKALSYPSLDELYYEIIKGFGVEFVEKDQKIFARVKNRGKNDVFLIECTDRSLIEVCNSIWASMN